MSGDKRRFKRWLKKRAIEVGKPMKVPRGMRRAIRREIEWLRQTGYWVGEKRVIKIF